MSRRLPDCAYCGKTLKRKERLLAHYGDLPGKPDVGWHTDKCMTADPLCKPMTGDGKETIAKISKRGKSRVVKGWTS